MPGFVFADDFLFSRLDSRLFELGLATIAGALPGTDT